ncbi:sensor histidine kinase [Actinoplanes sp. TBRC 11911]|uniref:sensor histidine kinase n=1 Tax=Actinoplanes sp. TBRC 11911 TaxID=2729386 RepID=UPI00289BA76D|nr:sensor histidine kinase [Actinoplanes sp. TBRC 11911]
MTTEPFEHPGLLYRGSADYLAATTTFVRDALEAGRPVLVAVPAANLDLLRGALVDDGWRITFADMAVAGRNPGRILPRVLLDFAGRHRGYRAAIIGEPVWAARTPLELDACAIHEALINAVFAGRDATILCPYAVSTLRPAAILNAWRTHPQILDGGVLRRSTSYVDPLTTADDLDVPLPPVPEYAKERVVDDRADLPRLRAFVRQAAGTMLSPDRLDDLVMAANELVTNTLRHTRGGGRIAVWPESGVLVCQVDDAGPSPGPLAGRVPLPPDDTGGRGLLLVNDLCDLVRLHRHPAGTSVRVHVAT